jgi:uncharacterized protein
MVYELLNTAESISDRQGAIELIAPGKTNFFIDILGELKALNAPFYNTLVENDFIFRCSIKPDFQNTYDAGFILAYDTDDKWIKFAFENTDLGYPSAVAVVTSVYSDDCNGEKIESEDIFMQIVRSGDNWCLHYSHDRSSWKMVRYFKLSLNKKIRIGVSSQSPVGGGCRVIFKDVELLKNNYTNIRKAE